MIYLRTCFCPTEHQGPFKSGKGGGAEPPLPVHKNRPSGKKKQSLHHLTMPPMFYKANFSYSRWCSLETMESCSFTAHQDGFTADWEGAEKLTAGGRRVFGPCFWVCGEGAAPAVVHTA